jgi:hypothetical protein
MPQNKDSLMSQVVTVAGSGTVKDELRPVLIDPPTYMKMMLYAWANPSSNAAVNVMCLGRGIGKRLVSALRQTEIVAQLPSPITFRHILQPG